MEETRQCWIYNDGEAEVKAVYTYEYEIIITCRARSKEIAKKYFLPEHYMRYRYTESEHERAKKMYWTLIDQYINKRFNA